MKKYISTLIMVISAFSAIAQSSNSNSILIRHDTTLLKADECEWIIRSLVKNDLKLTPELGKPLSLFLLGAIEKGKLKAFDGFTNEPIPAKKIMTWKMPADSVMTFDDNGNASKIVIVQRERMSDQLNRVRIFQDWYLDIATGKFHSEIKWVELMEEVHSSIGDMLGYSVLCRIYY